MVSLSPPRRGQAHHVEAGVDVDDLAGDTGFTWSAQTRSARNVALAQLA